jgi:hypothetical protein
MWVLAPKAANGRKCKREMIHGRLRDAPLTQVQPTTAKLAHA